MNTPLISVIIPAYNCAQYIGEALLSIVNQTYKNLEIIVVNDGSTDETLLAIQQVNDPRIKVLENTSNSGIIFTLNKALKEAKGKYIARMDGDDIAMADRIAIQYHYLESHPDISILGAKIKYFGAENHVVNTVLSTNEIAIEMYFNNPINHPTVMMRRADLEKQQLHYPENFIHAEDWVFWFNCQAKQLKIANLPNVLLKYRIEGQNITANNRATEKERHLEVYRYFLGTIFKEVNEDLLSLHWAVARVDLNHVDVKALKVYLQQLEAALIQANHPEKEVKAAIQRRKNRLFYKVADESAKQGFTYMVQNQLYSFKNLRYLWSKVKKA
ncbi:glycosyltransferase family 2 protein [Putridiphycobacter roseus]|nr:glycosyltransferase family A protein [Putridiphycobacter roseus]